ncbi:hypothetical protein JCGZ_12663 [Jatropha curcas]|uniref:Uncharacterized protein n=1 Tax=Jatropha curcas TaxID=180498 RepID=A0A067KPV1_JATCU|nr:hypothetical protein JCGZ_12663 [Jatropha curcas]
MQDLLLKAEHGGIIGGTLILPGRCDVPTAAEWLKLGSERYPWRDVVDYPNFIQAVVGWPLMMTMRCAGYTKRHTSSGWWRGSRTSMYLELAGTSCWSRSRDTAWRAC